jgi:hypothetical protein
MVEEWDTTEENKKAIEHWEKFYATEKDKEGNFKYPFVGRVVRQ